MAIEQPGQQSGGMPSGWLRARWIRRQDCAQRGRLSECDDWRIRGSNMPFVVQQKRSVDGNAAQRGVPAERPFQREPGPFLCPPWLPAFVVQPPAYARQVVARENPFCGVTENGCLLRLDIQRLPRSVRIADCLVSEWRCTTGPPMRPPEPTDRRAGPVPHSLSFASRYFRLEHESEPEGVPVSAVDSTGVQQPYRVMCSPARRGVLPFHDVQERRSNVQPSRVSRSTWNVARTSARCWRASDSHA